MPIKALALPCISIRVGTFSIVDLVKNQGIVLKKEIITEERNCFHFYNSSSRLKTSFNDDIYLCHLLSKSSLQNDTLPSAITLPLQSLNTNNKLKIFINEYEPPAWNLKSKSLWCDDAIRNLYVPNAGGLSETCSIQFMHDVFKAKNCVFEMEMIYYIRFKICDYLVRINGFNVGVSTTRAFQYNDYSTYSIEQAKILLKKKLTGLVLSRSCICEAQEFYTSILHIFVPCEFVASCVKQAYIDMLTDESMDFEIENEASIKDVVVIISICARDEIYSGKKFVNPF